ncbi:hypothetical protein [Roseivirga sp.]|uniref:hypothetical protein n=1 Tax=Roseivirga sp. TaxID=1964215 RepID=UPI003B8DD078
MKKYIYTILVALFASISLIAQEKEKAAGFLDISYNPIASAQKNELFGGFSLTYSKPLNDRLTLGIEGFYAPSANKSGLHQDVSSITGINVRNSHNITASLSLDLKYFLKKGAFQGHYFGARVNNLLTYASTIRSFDIEPSKREIKALPMIGFYYGYRKSFLKSFFVDASVGLNPHFQPFKDVRINVNQVFDFRLTIGYRIKLSKKR